MFKSAHSLSRLVPERFLAIALVALIGVSGCRADQEAVDPPGTDVQVDLGPNPAIEQAPPIPSPDAAVPVGATDPNAPPPTVVDLDTIPGARQQPGAAPGQQPGVQQPGMPQQPGTQQPPAPGQPRSP